MRILVTGAGGFVAGHLLPALKRRWPEAELLGWGLQAQDGPWCPVQARDITDQAVVERALAAWPPTHLAHLAGQAHVPTSFDNPQSTWRVNVLGTLNILHALRGLKPAPMVLYVSSSEVYGDSFRERGGAVDETTLLQPASPYAASKAAADLMARQFARQGLHTLIARPFNHIGPGQSLDFVVPAFAAQIAAIEAGRQEPVLRVGNLDARRDFLHVDDVVAAYVAMLDRAPRLAAGEVFNIASGQTHPIRAVLDGLLSLSRHRGIRVEHDPARMRPSDTPLAQGDAGKARRLLDWQPRMPWTDALASVLQHSRAALCR